MSNHTLRSAIAVTAFLASLPACLAAQTAGQKEANDKLMIVNGNSGHVIYDDGRDDMYCVTRRHIIGYDRYGNAVRSRSMRCR